MTPRKILIAGGGLAAWMTAAYLQAVLNRDGRNFADIGVVDAARDRTENGESTIPEINRFLAILGVNQLEFLRRVRGTFKQAGKFVNWLHADGHAFYHPFSMERPGNVDRSAQRWLRSGRTIPFAETVSAQPKICEKNLAPLMLGRWDFGQALTYAFHLDTEDFTAFLREFATARGVRLHSGRLHSVSVSADGSIASLCTDADEELCADLFVDCTGPAALLCGAALGVDWVDCRQWLPCDRAISLRVPYETRYPGFVRPYTLASAVSAGWIEDVPLQDSRCLRYFYSSAFRNDEDAERELRDWEGDHSASLAAEAQGFGAGHRSSAWVANCVAIGAACSAVEPLESTRLYTIGLAAAMLAEHFPLGEEMEALAWRYNRIVANRFYEVMDLVNLHYCLSRRTDSEFWMAVQRDERVNERLQAKLRFWREKRPTLSDFEDQHFPGQASPPLSPHQGKGDARSPVDTAALWNHENYEAILYGMDFLASECDARYGEQRPDSSVARHVIERVLRAPSKLPTHEEWLRRVSGMRDYTTPETGT